MAQTLFAAFLSDGQMLRQSDVHFLGTLAFRGLPPHLHSLAWSHSTRSGCSFQPVRRESNRTVDDNIGWIDACDDFYLHAIDNNDLRIDVVTDCYKTSCYWLLQDKLLLIVTRQKQQPDSCHTWREPTKPTTSECKDLWKRRGSPWIKRQCVCRQEMAFKYLEMSL